VRSGGDALKVVLLLTCSFVLASTAAEEIYNVGGGVSAPRLIHKVEPEYTQEARDADYQGTVVLKLIITKEGVPDRIEVVQGLELGLTEKAIEALEQWRFQAAEKDGKPVNVRATVEINFRLL
jgi:TonB family protein